MNSETHLKKGNEIIGLLGQFKDQIIDQNIFAGESEIRRNQLKSLCQKIFDSYMNQIALENKRDSNCILKLAESISKIEAMENFEMGKDDFLALLSEEIKLVKNISDYYKQ